MKNKNGLTIPQLAKKIIEIIWWKAGVVSISFEYFISHLNLRQQKNILDGFQNETLFDKIYRTIISKCSPKQCEDILWGIIDANQADKARIMVKILDYCIDNDIDPDIYTRILYDISQCNINDLLDCIDSIKKLHKMCIIEQHTHENYQWYTARPPDREGAIIFDETKTAGGFATEGMIYISLLKKDLQQIIINGKFKYLTQYKSFVGSNSINSLFYDKIKAGIYDEFLPKTQPQSIINN
jgi:hypothetical protein